MFFEGFALRQVSVPGGALRVRVGGSGPPLLLLHGNPQTHAMWHRLAPVLARRFTVVAPDLRGYGGSMKPPATADHKPYAKTAMARDMVEVMAGLGFERFDLLDVEAGPLRPAEVVQELGGDSEDHDTGRDDAGVRAR